MDIRMPEIDGANAIGMIRKEHEDVKIIVLTMYDKRTSLSKQVADEVRNYFDKKVFKTVIPRNVRLSEAPSYGESIFEYDKLSKGAQAYRDLAKEVIRRG